MGIQNTPIDIHSIHQDGLGWFRAADVSREFNFMSTSHIKKHAAPRNIIKDAHGVNYVNLEGLRQVANNEFFSSRLKFAADNLRDWIDTLTPGHPSDFLATSMASDIYQHEVNPAPLVSNAQKEHHMATANTVQPSANNATQIFDFEGQNVRTVTIDNEPWFVLGDVMKVLELNTNDSNKIKKRLDQADQNTTLVSDGTQNRRATIINESGLYDVILDSRKPQAKEFRHWITSKVIPSIRKTGTYSMSEIQEHFQLPTNFVEALESLVAAEKDKIVLTNENKQLTLTNHTLDIENYELSAVNAEMKPLAEEYKALMDSRGTFSMMDAAKIVGIGRTTLFQFLRDEKILMSLGSNKNVAYQQYTNYFQTRAHRWEDRDGNSRVGKTTYVYPAGLDFIAKRLRKAGRI